MSKKAWTLLECSLDAAADVYCAELSLDATQLGLPNCTVRKQTLHGGLRDGVDLLTIDNGRLSVALLPQRGMGIWRAWLGDLPIGWNSPVRGPVHPRFVPVGEPSGLGFLDGFDELLVRCGLDSNGAPDFDSQGRLVRPLHGRIANLPAHRLVVAADTDSGELSVTGIVDECRFHFQKLRLTSTLRMRPGETGFRLTDEVTNLSGNPGEMQLLYHINFGPPLAEPGSRLLAPVARLMPRTPRAAAGIDAWDRYSPPHAGAEEEVFFFRLLAGADGRTQTLLKNAASTRGVSLRYHTGELPYFIVWKNTAPLADGYVTGLEPALNFPNPRSFETKQGRVRRLAPGETVRFELELEAHDDAAAVKSAEGAIALLQAAAAPEICRQPDPDWVMS